MLSLVSVKDVEEAKACMGLVDVIDVKNPEEGSLGASFIWTIKDVSELSRANGTMVSATVGDLDKSGLASLASYAIADFVDFVKVGVLANGKKAEEIVKSVVKSVNGRSKVIAVAYADYSEVNSVSPSELVEIAKRCKADGVVIDTVLKVKPSFEILNADEIRDFVSRARSYGLITALAGGLNWKHVDLVKRLKPDVVGVRGLVCRGDRKGSLDVELVRRFVDYLQR